MTQDKKENYVNRSFSPHSPGTNPALPLQNSVTPASPHSFEIQVPALRSGHSEGFGHFWQGPAPY